MFLQIHSAWEPAATALEVEEVTHQLKIDGENA